MIAWKIQGKCRIYEIITMKMYFRDASFPELIREKFENSLEISENTGNLVCPKCGHPGSIRILARAEQHKRAIIEGSV